MCKARLHKPIGVDDPAHFIVKHGHSHAGDARKLGKRKVHNKLKEMAKDTNAPATQIIAESVFGEQKSTIAILPSNKSMTKTIYRQRTGHSTAKLPRNVAEIVMTDELRNTKDGISFLLYDTENELADDDRTMIFGTADNVRFLAKCDQLFMDGTFSITPPLFRQVYIIHGNTHRYICLFIEFTMI